ncbi:hypothetical protein C8246_21865 [Paracidovorax avenae]|uniref:hypothetical protein n=1 Tax=Paracidovorax avenae TaxID=80867 RepID=UPI000D169970|nr:hypothetical protein [Paracidovorax avenae]AVS93946.1 hypothetical protein C8246_21865 [Paracidovorax avenae]AVT21282.1 hypothetical protein C7Y68_15835 [Paracidovorax avenae]
MNIYICVKNGLLAGVQRTTGEIQADGYIKVAQDPGTEDMGRQFLGLNEDGEPLFGAVPDSTAGLGRRISVGAFYDRFGAAKLAILSDDSLPVRAVIQDASVRRFIDLDRSDLPGGLAILQAAGHAIDPQQILEAPVRAEELP